MSQGVTREKPGLKVGTEAARLAFLYGEGNGERVLTVKALCKVGGVEEQTIRRHLPAWEKEYGEIVAGERNNGFRLILSPADIATHKANVEAFRALEAELAVEIATLPKVEKYLRGLVDWFKEHGTAGDVADMRDTINSFLRITASRKSLVKQRLDVNARWNQLTGVMSLIDAAGAREKAMATGRAKIDLDAERKAAGMGPDEPVKPVPPVGRRYVKKGEPLEADAIEPAIEAESGGDEGLGSED